jgi:hypothetical protein
MDASSVKVKLRNGGESEHRSNCILYVAPMIYYRRVKASRGESYAFES